MLLVASHAVTQPAEDEPLFGVYGNVTTVEPVPGLVAIDRALNPGDATTTHGAIPNLYGIAVSIELFELEMVPLATSVETQARR